MFGRIPQWIILVLTFVCTELYYYYYYYRFYFTFSDLSVQNIFFIDSVLTGYIFLETHSLLIGCQIVHRIFFGFFVFRWYRLSFPVSQFFTRGGQSIGASVSASVLPMNIQDWFPLGWPALISLQSNGTLKSLLQHHSSKASILWCSALCANCHMTTGKTIALTRWTFVGKLTSLLFNMLCRLVITFLPRSNVF